jgi:hypothetical protein
MTTSVRVASIVAFLCPLICSRADCQEIVSAEPLTKSEILATLPVLAFRQIPVNKVISEITQGSGWGIEPDAVIGSAFSSEPNQKKIWDNLVSNKTSDPKALDLLKRQSEKAVGVWQETYAKKAAPFLSEQIGFSFSSDNDRKSRLNELLETDSGDAANKTIPIFTFAGKRLEQVDAEAVGYIMAINKDYQHYDRTSQSKTTIDYSLDPRFALRLKEAYYPISLITAASPDIEKVAAVSNGVQTASMDLPTAASLLIREGQAGIGK